VKEVGAHPKDQKPINLYEGKFGLYLKYASTNASLPKDVTAEQLTLEKAIELINDRKGKGKKKKSG
jgi:DNA topoisomerase-1